MGKDFDYRHAAYNGGLGAVPMEPVLESQPGPSPAAYSYRSPAQTPASAASTPSPGPRPDNIDGDEALMDLAQLEDLHNEAERMKGLGNKHMAAQVRNILLGSESIRLLPSTRCSKLSPKTSRCMLKISFMLLVFTQL